MKFELLTNATVVDDAISFVSSQKSNEDLRLSSNESDKEESKEVDYDEGKDQLEEEQEGKTGEAPLVATTNHIF